MRDRRELRTDRLGGGTDSSVCGLGSGFGAVLCCAVLWLSLLMLEVAEGWGNGGERKMLPKKLREGTLVQSNDEGSQR